MRSRINFYKKDFYESESLSTFLTKKIAVTSIWNRYSELRNSCKKLNRFLQIIFLQKRIFIDYFSCQRKLKLVIFQPLVKIKKDSNKSCFQRTTITTIESKRVRTFDVCGRIGAICQRVKALFSQKLTNKK